MPTWGQVAPHTSAAARYQGRLAAVADRGQRSSMAYDRRGNATWSMRQMAVIPDEGSVTLTNANPGPALPPTVSESPAAPTAREYDVAHPYQRTATFDHGGRPRTMTLPADPDWTGGGAAPEIGGTITYDARGLPTQVQLTVDGAPKTIVGEIRYTEHGLVERVEYGDGTGRAPTVSTTTYDACLRPREFETVREATAGSGQDLALVTTPMHQRLTWDEANNLVRIEDLRDASEWPAGYRPQTVDVFHDALYRVVNAHYTYAGGPGGGDQASNWRTDMATHRPDDPMRTTPAPMAAALPPDRVRSLTWQYDWLGNMQEWTDDAHAFYERSLGDIENGADRAAQDRPAALHLATDIRQSSVAPTSIDLGEDRGGWVELTYGQSGNVVEMTVHGQCRDPDASTACWDDVDLEGSARAIHLRASCFCATEQHYTYEWDELNRLAEARRYDRVGGSTGSWTAAVRQRYRYDSANQRTVKQTLDVRAGEADPERIALYVYPGDFERRGLVRGAFGEEYEASTGLDTETQYLVGGARVVWKTRSGVPGLDPDQRVTVPLTDLIQTTAAVLDIETGELLEASTYYPNGARETFRTQALDGIPAEPSGFTGKEGDEEVGLVYFGERYLIPRVGRWASADPLEIHKVGGGEGLNAYHYVAGSVLQSRDPLGLTPGQDPTMVDGSRTPTASGSRPERSESARAAHALGVVAGQLQHRIDAAERNLEVWAENPVMGHFLYENDAREIFREFGGEAAGGLVGGSVYDTYQPSLRNLARGRFWASAEADSPELRQAFQEGYQSGYSQSRLWSTLELAAMFVPERSVGRSGTVTLFARTGSHRLTVAAVRRFYRMLHRRTRLLSRREQYPRSFRLSTIRELERTYGRRDAAGDLLLDRNGRVRIFRDPSSMRTEIPRDQLHWDHIRSVAEHWNSEGRFISRSRRRDWYNDVNNLRPMSAAENTSRGSGGHRFIQQTGAGYSN